MLYSDHNTDRHFRHLANEITNGFALVRSTDDTITVDTGCRNPRVPEALYALAHTLGLTVTYSERPNRLSRYTLTVDPCAVAGRSGTWPEGVTACEGRRFSRNVLSVGFEPTGSDAERGLQIAHLNTIAEDHGLRFITVDRTWGGPWTIVYCAARG